MKSIMKRSSGDGRHDRGKINEDILGIADAARVGSRGGRCSAVRYGLCGELLQGVQEREGLWRQLHFPNQHLQKRQRLRLQRLTCDGDLQIPGHAAVIVRKM